MRLALEMMRLALEKTITSRRKPETDNTVQPGCLQLSDSADDIKQQQDIEKRNGS